MSNDAAEYEVGTHSVDVTPPFTIPYLAGNPRHSYFTGVHDPLYACATVVSDGQREVALVSIDGIGFSNGLLGKERDFTDELKKRIEQETGIKKEAVMLMSGHIHSTPDTIDFRPLREIPSVLPWLETLCSQICNAIVMASKNKFKANLKIGTGKAEELTRNRREENCLDTEVIVLLFESLNREEKVIIVNYACHPVIVQVQEWVSADFIGAMRNVVQDRLKGIEGCLFIQGACGDINPAVGCTQDFEDVSRFGTALATEVIEVFDRITAAEYPVEALNVAALSQTIQLLSRPLPSLEEAENMGEEALWRIREGNSPYAAEIQLIRLGNCIITGIPGEPMCRMGLEIKELFRPLVAVPAGYANGYVGYLASSEDWRKGGYEVELGPWSKVGFESYDRVIATVKSMGKDLMNSHPMNKAGGRDE